MTSPCIKLSIRLRPDQKSIIDRAAKAQNQTQQTYCLKAIIATATNDLRDPLAQSGIALQKLGSLLIIQELLTKLLLSQGISKDTIDAVSRNVWDQIGQKFPARDMS